MRLVVLLLGSVITLAAHDPITTKLTWTRDISRLVNRRCIGCHGAQASIALATYEQARPWAKAIRDQVMTRQMPPWGAVPGFGVDLKDDPSLTQTEIDTVVRWVEGGAPNGDEALLPHGMLPAPQPRPVLTGRLFTPGCEWHAASDFKLLGVRAEGLGPQNEMRLVLTRADGSMQPVLWIRGAPRDTPAGDFVFAKPLAIPRGSVLHVESDVGAGAALSLSPEAAWLRLPGTESRKQRRRCPGP